MKGMVMSVKSEWGWLPDPNDVHICRTADGIEIKVGMKVVDYDRKVATVIGAPAPSHDTVCWSCAGHAGHWWQTTNGSFDGSRMTTKGLAELERQEAVIAEHRPYLGPSSGVKLPEGTAWHDTGWKVVGADQYGVTVMTPCICGDNDCYWTATAGRRDMYNPNIDKRGDGS